MEFDFVKNTQLDLRFLEKTLKNESQMRMVNPSANFPFEKDYWLNFFNMENPTSSYFLRVDGKVIGHSALQFKEDDKSLWLCWVLLDPTFRGTGASEKLLNKTEKFVKSEFSLDEYFLNVRQENTIAIKFYERMGFENVSEGNGNFQMKKKI